MIRSTSSLDHSIRTPLRAPSSRFFFAAVCLAIAAGGWQGSRRLPWNFEPPERHPRWAARYEALAPLVADSPRVLFVQEDNRRGSHRLFRAQFVLSPSVIEQRSTLAKVWVRQLTRQPLILDYRSHRKLRAALRALEQRATKAGLELRYKKVGHFAVVRAYRAEKR